MPVPASVCKRERWFAVGLVITVALLVRIIFFSGGVRGSDAYAYALHAFEIASGQYQIHAIDSFYGFRFSLLLPTALSYRLFGINDYSSVLFLYLCSLMNIGVIFLLAEKLYGWKMALLAAMLVTLYPLDIFMANMLSPDSIIPFFSSLALLFYILAQEKSLSTRTGHLVLVFAGLCIGLAYLSRLTSIFLFIALFCYHLFRKQSPISLLWLSVGLVIPWSIEAAYYYLYTGDLLFHYHQIAVHEELVKGPNPDAIVSLLFYPKVMFGFDRTGWACYGLLWWLVLAGLILAYLRRDHRLGLPVFCLIIPFLGFEFGTQSLKEMIPIMKNYNYLALLTCPAVLIGAYALKEGFLMASSRISRPLVPFILIIAVIAAMNLYGVYRLSLNAKNDAAPYIAVADALRGATPSPIYVHHDRWPLFLKFFLRYNRGLEFRTMNNLDKGQIANISGAYIILHKRYLEADTAGRPLLQRPVVADYWRTPLPNWKRMVSYEGRPPYNSVLLFHAPEQERGR